jgi:hypothetical protein
MKVIAYCIYIVALVIWTIVGFLFWIPFLARSIAAFSGMILYSALTGVDSKALGRQVEQAIEFYPVGFRRIGEALFGATGTTDAQPPVVKFDRFVLDIVWTLLFWGLLLAWLIPPAFLRDAFSFWLRRG